MPKRTAPVYQRGKYWLAHDERADGTLRSPYLYIWWYDAAARRERSASTGTADPAQAIVALDRRYLADTDEAPAFCHACGQPLAKAEAYLLTDAVADYKLEWGDKQISADAIAARLKHVVDFMVAQEEQGESRFGIATSCAVAATSAFANAFRAWSRQQPVVARKKDGTVTASRPRSPATTEESINQLIAVLNHAVAANPPRSDKQPAYRSLPRKQVSRPRRTRLDVPTLARMVAYAAQGEKRRDALHAFLVASICTIARPSAVVDINVSPTREQWWPGSTTIDLNPHGRAQTKKGRAVLPVLPLLSEWLEAELARWNALPVAERATRGWLVNYYGRPVQSVKKGWSTMLEELKLPQTREWGPYILRHSLATIVRNRGATKWDLEGFMGHRLAGQTEVYAIGEFQSVETALQSVIEELEKLAPGALHRSDTGAGLPVIQRKDRKMTG